MLRIGRERWASWLKHPGYDDVPFARPSLGIVCKELLDRGILALMSGTSGFWARPRDVDAYVKEEVVRAVELYGEEGWLDDPASYHVRPPELRHVEIKRAFGWPRHEHLRFESEYEPPAGDPGRERWLDYADNRTAHAFLMRQADESRPWLVTIHGYGMGHAIADFQGIRARHLHGTLGMNVVAYVMPLHGPRRTTGTFGSDLFTGGVANIVHGEAQAMWDLRRIFSWIRSRGATKIGVKGLSLGGYTAALMACLEDDLACAIAGIPACDFIDLFRRHMPRDYGEIPAEVEAFWSDARRVLSVISPLAMPPRIPRERRFIFAGLVDRLVPPAVVRELWEHWDRPQIGWYPGSHVSFLLEPTVREFLESAYRACGMVTAEAV